LCYLGDPITDTGECYLGNCLSFQKQCFTDSRTLTATPLDKCSYDQQVALNQGEFCGTLFCNEPSQTTCVFLTVSGQTDTVRDGIPCSKDPGQQCLKGQCIDSSNTQPQFFWIPTAWGSCASCSDPQNRSLLCYFQDKTLTPLQPPVLIDPVYCSPTSKPATTQICDNVTLGCVDMSIFASDSINFFGVVVQKYALILAVLGAVVLLLVILAGCYYAVTYQSGMMINPRVRRIGNNPQQAKRGQVAPAPYHRPNSVPASPRGGGPKRPSQQAQSPYLQPQQQPYLQAQSPYLQPPSPRGGGYQNPQQQHRLSQNQNYQPKNISRSPSRDGQYHIEPIDPNGEYEIQFN